jgi:hypothetical protein
VMLNYVEPKPTAVNVKGLQRDAVGAQRHAIERP